MKAEITVKSASRLVNRVRFFPVWAWDGAFCAPTDRLILVRDGRRVLARALCGRAPSGDGFLAGLQARDEAGLRALTDAAREVLAPLGCGRIVGPLALDHGGFGNGALVSGFEGEPTLLEPDNGEELPRMLEACGWVKERDLLDWRLSRADFPAAKYERIAGYACRRFGYTLRPVGREGKRALYETMLRVYGQTEETGVETRALARQVQRLGTLMRPSLCVMREGNPVGLLCAMEKNAQVRVATLHVVEAERRRGVPAVLFCGLYKSLPPGIRWIQAAVIDEGNAPSLACAEGCGARLHRVYRVFTTKI